MSQSEDEEYGVTSVSISDWPDFAMRAVLLDLNPYGRVPKMDTMLGIIDVLSLIKINQFHIFFRVGSTDASYLCYCKRSVNTLKVRYEQQRIGLAKKYALNKKNLQFSSNQADIQPKLPIHKLVILVKYQID